MTKNKKLVILVSCIGSETSSPQPTRTPITSYVFLPHKLYSSVLPIPVVPGIKMLELRCDPVRAVPLALSTVYCIIQYSAHNGHRLTISGFYWAYTYGVSPQGGGIIHVNPTRGNNTPMMTTGLSWRTIRLKHRHSGYQLSKQRSIVDRVSGKPSVDVVAHQNLRITWFYIDAPEPAVSVASH
ncbi:hypothetical protein GGR50DRAFT_511798 [Xylaria sp. CBS 124048]|nr:hypothetical protein GGR50DRAFT_511798 [Xylaria sp. CBS 124048]